MKDIDFSDMRPFEPDELPAAYDELLSDPIFCKMVGYLFPEIPLDMIAARMRSCRTCLEFQLTFCAPFLEGIVKKHSDGLTGDFSAVAPTTEKQNYTYISNHRDIVLDPGLLDLLLVRSGLPTVEIAIGDNLLIYPWIKTFVRINRSFIVTRSGGLRDILVASNRLSAYMHHAVNKKGSAIWIAQREGRSKDSQDQTQESLLKMLTIAGKGSPKEKLKALHLTPLAISYEYDPCDWLKAKEFQQKRDIEGFQKSPADDLINMRTGIFGRKGRIHYHASACINTFLDTLPDTLPKQEFFTAVAEHIDRCIYANYRLYPGNIIAIDLLEGGDTHASLYTADERRTFETYLESQLANIDLPDKDEAFLRQKMLEMYANPAIHQFDVLQ